MTVKAAEARADTAVRAQSGHPNTAVRPLLLAVLACLAASTAQGSHHVDEQQAIIRYDGVHHPVIGTAGMVVSQRRAASQAGANILAAGGNAVDAAVATALALAVTLPRAGNLGGGGFMLIYLAAEDRYIAIDFREKAPAAAHRDMFLDASGEVDSRLEEFSYRSSGVPGSVAGLAHASERYGALPWERLFREPVALAAKGVEVSYDLAENLKKRHRWLTRNAATAEVFYRQGQVPYEPGETLVQPDLANTLQLLAEQGADAFYRGSIAKRIAKDMQENGGLIQLSDLAAYRAVERPVVRTRYRDYEYVSMPPPSSGGVHIAQMLNILEQHELGAMGYGSADSIHLMAEAMKLAYSDRSRYLGDPDFFQVPVRALISKEYAKRLNRKVSLRRARPSKRIRPGQRLPVESPDTTHLSVMDAAGNAVVLTTTLNFSYGSGIVIRGTGVLMNNEMADFSAKAGVPNAFGLLGGEANRIEPEKRPLSSMAPSVLLRDGKPYLLTGSPGGSRILTTVLQMIVNIVDFEMNVAEATAAPRIHHQWLPDKLYMEGGFSPDTKRLLRARGHNVVDSKSMGSLQSILYEGGYFYGASDPRRPGAGAVAVRPDESR